MEAPTGVLVGAVARCEPARMAGQDAGARAGRAIAGMFAAVAAISTAAIAIREAQGWAAPWIGAGRVAVTAILFAPFAGRQLATLWTTLATDRSARRRVALASVLLGAHFAAWIASLSMTSVVTSVGLVATQPLFAGLLGRWLGDHVPRRVYVGAGVAVVGGVLMSGELGDFAGAGLAVAGAVFAAGYLAVGRSVRDTLPLRAYFVTVHAGAALTLALFALAIRAPLPTLTNDAWIFVLYLGVVPGVIGHGLMNWAVRHVPLHLVSLLILLEPVGSGVLAWLHFGEVPGPGEVGGGALLLAGIAIGAWPARASSRGEPRLG